MSFQPKPVEMDNRYAIRTDGERSAVFPMETVEVEKVGTCFGSVGIWVSNTIPKLPTKLRRKRASGQWPLALSRSR